MVSSAPDVLLVCPTSVYASPVEGAKGPTLTRDVLTKVLQAIAAKDDEALLGMMQDDVSSPPGGKKA